MESTLPDALMTAAGRMVNCYWPKLAGILSVTQGGTSDEIIIDQTALDRAEPVIRFLMGESVDIYSTLTTSAAEAAHIAGMGRILRVIVRLYDRTGAPVKQSDVSHNVKMARALRLDCIEDLIEAGHITTPSEDGRGTRYAPTERGRAECALL